MKNQSTQSKDTQVHLSQGHWNVFHTSAANWINKGVYISACVSSNSFHKY